MTVVQQDNNYPVLIGRYTGMVKIKTCDGVRRRLFNIWTCFDSVFHYIPHLLKRKITVAEYIGLLKRMALYTRTFENNKYVRVNGKMRIGLYVSAYGTKPYWATNDKLLSYEKAMVPSTVLFSVTSACRNKCEHCYQKNDRGKDIGIDTLIEAAVTLQDMGVPYFIIEGGDSFLVWDKLKKLVAALDGRSEIWVNTTGDEVTMERVMELKKLGMTAVRFSLHRHDPESFNRFLGVDWAWDNLIKGTDICYRAGVPVVFNSCVDREGFYNGDFEKLMDRARQLKGVIIEIIHPKRAGGWLSQPLEPFTEDDFQRLRELVRTYNFNPQYRDYPMISCQIMEEDTTMYGCSAGGVERFYVNAKGDVQPCEFLNISFGNIGREKIDTIFKRMRSHFMLPGQTWLCDACAPEISRLAAENGVTSLPLNEELSRQIYTQWDRGRPTVLYKQLFGSFKSEEE